MRFFLLCFLGLFLLSLTLTTCGTDSLENSTSEVSVTENYTAYLMCYFRTSAEALHYAYSQDGLSWTELNGNLPVLWATQGNKSIRDPYIICREDGIFQLLSTDSWSSRNILAWQSTDLINWTNETLVPIAPSNAGCAWAPECIYDPANSDYMVYWSTNLGPDISGPKQIWYARTSDFSSFTTPDILFDPGYTVIDADIVENNGTFYMQFKDERDGYKYLRQATADNLQGPYSNVSGQITPSGSTEGPLTFKLINQNKRVMYYDYFLTGNYGASWSADLTNWTGYEAGDLHLPNGPRHCGIIPITDAELNALKTKWGYKKLVNRNSGKLADVTSVSIKNGALIIQWLDNGGINQQWQLLDTGSGYYKIINRNSGKLLDVTGGSTVDGAQIIQWQDNGGNNQQWQLLNAGSGYYKIINRNSGKLLDVTGGSTENSAQLIQSSDSGETHQQWQIK
jgi:sucrose-6-phosphate hydrolase SacC (GH32 family)